MRKFSTSIISGFNIIFLVSFLVLAMSVGFFPARNKFQLFLPVSMIIIVAIALIAFVFHFANRFKFPTKLKFLRPHIVLLTFGILLIIQLVVAMALESSGYTWDSQIIMTQATNYALNGSIDSSIIQYFSDSPNNIPILSILGALFRLLHHYHIDNFMTAAVLLSATLLWLTQLLIFFVARTLYGGKIAAISVVFSFALLTLSMHVQTVYTDTLTIIFPVSLFYLSLLATRTNKLSLKMILCAAIGILTVIGALIKPTVVIAFIAILIVGIVWLVNNYSRRKLEDQIGLIAAYFTATLLAMAFTYSAYILVANKLHIVPFPVETVNAGGIPPSHFAAIGIITHHNSNTTEYGGFDAIQSEAISKLSTTKERNDYSYQIIKNQLADYGGIGYLVFIAHKANWILSDSTFYAYGEGSNDHVVFTHQDVLSTHLRYFMNQSGQGFINFANFLQVFWVGVLLLIGMQAILVFKHKDTREILHLTMLRLMIAGIIIFLLIFEGRSRYILLYLPIFILLALHTVKIFIDEPADTLRLTV